MSRPLARLLPFSAILVMVVTGCAHEVPKEIIYVQPPPAAVEAPKPLPVRKWLRWQDTVATMSPSQLDTVLEGMAPPGNTHQLFYYGLLNQQAESYESWVIARDIFRELQQKDELTREQRRLASLLERYNQSRINWFQSREQVMQQYQESEQLVIELQEQNLLLEQKIQAITDLEETISTRSEE